MEAGYVRLFSQDLIAIHRPNKSTYSILQYRGNKWKRFILNPALIPSIVLYGTPLPVAPVKIAIDSSGHFVHCTASSNYLLYDNKNVTVIKKLPNSVKKFPQSYYSGEITVAARGVRENNEALWVVQEPLHAPVHVPVPVARIKLPQHIAWIIAEDACKNKIDCAITLNPISPVTASVTNCFHVFETEAITQAILISSKCPVCREKNPVITKCLSA